MSGRAAGALGGLSHLMAWAALLWLVLWPSFYQGAVATATPSGGPAGQPTRTAASLIAVNGWWVLSLLLVPVVLSALGLLAATVVRHKPRPAAVLLWLSAVLLLGFCAAGAFSIGLSYLPAAAALLAAALAGSWPTRARSR